jgi:hypothetical protein
MSSSRSFILPTWKFHQHMYLQFLIISPTFMFPPGSKNILLCRQQNKSELSKQLHNNNYASKHLIEGIELKLRVLFAR